MKYLSLFFSFIFISFFGYSQPQYELSNDIPVNENENPLINAWTGGFNSASFNKADLNGDQDEELIVIDRNAQQILVFQGQDGQYVNASHLKDNLPDIGHDWAVFADYNCDGLKDIFFYGNNGVNVYQNISSGEFIDWELVAAPLKTVGFSGPINLIVNSSDIPAVSDIDGDGDLDILSYNFATGEDIRFHRNMSVENAGSCGELDYEIVDRYWGEFKECDCNEYVYGENASCADLNSGRIAHSGGKFLLAKDLDGDKDQDIFLSHSDCNDLAYFENEGNIAEADINSFSNEFPYQVDNISFPIYPIINFLDLDFDGDQELIASPNIDFDYEFFSDFSNSSWLYDSVGTELRLVQKDFLKDGMLDLGELSKPQFFDYDQDGDEDLFIAYNGFEDDNKFYGAVALLENTGNVFEAEFTLVNSDYLNFSEYNLHAPVIRFYDFNSDGVMDLFFNGYNSTTGEVENYIYSGSSGSKGINFTRSEVETLNFTFRLFEAPVFFDVDGDGDPDMILGKTDGSLNLYENPGDMNFELSTSEYLGVGRDFTLTKLNLWPEIADIDQDGRMDLLVADSKEISFFSDFINSNDPEAEILQVYDSISDSTKLFDMQRFNSLALTDLQGLGYNSMILGGSGGGLKLYHDTKSDNSGDSENTLLIYPNPFSYNQQDPFLKIRTQAAGEVTIFSLNGQKLFSAQIPGKSISRLDIAHWRSGVYVVLFNDENGNSQSGKFVKID